MATIEYRIGTQYAYKEGMIHELMTLTGNGSQSQWHCEGV